MNYRDKPELQSKLAAEYVLGTLRGRARLRFQAWLRGDAALRRLVAEWEARLAPLAEDLGEARPPRHVWQGIEWRIGAADGAIKARFWDSLSFWRSWGLVASGCAAALVAALALQQPQSIEVPVLREVESPATGMQEAYVAILHAANDEQQTMLIAYAARESDALWVKRIDLDAPPADHGYELWGLPAQIGEPPKSLGMLPVEDRGPIRLAAVAEQALKDYPALAVSIEPAGGSRTGMPTGPVVAKGDCFRFW